MKKTAKNLSTVTTMGQAFKLKKVAAHMAAAALLSVVATQATSQALTTGRTGVLDGNNSGGFLITGDSRFTGATSTVTFGTAGGPSTQSLVHNFNTTGGAGSGGGAGLGGAFFVDAGASLTVINTDFKSNRVQGGAGGSAPAVGFYDQTLSITGASVDLPAILINAQPDVSGSPLLSYSGGQYSFDRLSINSDASTLIKKDSLAIFDDYGSTAKISNIDSGYVRFAAPVTVTALSSLSKSVSGSTGFSSVGGTVNVNYRITGQNVNPNNDSNTSDDYFRVDNNSLNVESIAGLQDVSVGAKLVARNGSATQQIATVTGVTYYTDADDAAANNGRGAATLLRGKVKSITLSTPLTANFADISAVDFIKAPSFKATQFFTNTDRSQVTVTSTMGTFVPGMTVSWEDANGVVSTSNVTAVSGRTLTLSTALPANVVDFKAVENPLVDANRVSVPNASGKFAVGQVVFVPGEGGIVFEGTVRSIDGNVVEVTPRAGGNLRDYYNPSVGLVLKISAGDVAGGGQSITVPFNTTGKTEASIRSLLVGRTVEGASFAEGTTVTGVTIASNGKITLSLSQSISNASSPVDYFRLYSPLKTGGSMNNLAAPAGSTGPNASNGYSANGASSFFNDSEGVDGTNGAPASEATTGAGRGGGNGGNGSLGLPVNFWLIYDLTAAIFSIKTASIDVAAAAADMAEAVTPDPVVGLAVELPDPMKIAAAVLGVLKSNIDLAFAITDTVLATTNLAWWAAQLGQGLAGLGGAGGDGGEASGGTAFFGGGAGGAGGNGGSGATPISDGGDGGSGGMGGAGGFGAGGGSGGAGGIAGSNGNAAGGDPGDGGYAGFGAGDGANGNGMFGGGGDGLGGAIFVRTGGSLRIKGNALFELNYTAGGSTTSQFGEAGYSAGSDLFMMKGSNVVLEPGLGKTIRFEGTIADDSMSTNDGYENASGAGSDIRIQGDGGLVIFNGENTYSGNTILEGATLTALVGTGVHNDSLIRFNGTGNMTPNIDSANTTTFNTVTSTMQLASVGTFLLQEDYVRRAGMDPSETAWTGSGGFGSALRGGVVVNLGKLNDEGKGQQLVWGQDGFFVPNDGGAGFSGVLTFGSEQSAGKVLFTNSVNLDNKVGRVAVYNNADLTNSDRSKATLSGNWGNTSGDSSALIVGDSSVGSPYTGNLFMTGQNNLDSLFVVGGVLSTYNDAPEGAAGKLFKSAGDAVVMADKRNTNASAHLQLFADESMRDMTILGGGALTLTQQLNVSGAFTNTGAVTILGARTNELPSTTMSSLKLGYLPTGFSLWEGQLGVTGALNNYGLLTQAGNVSAGSVVNSNQWFAFGDITSVGNITNNTTGALSMSGNVATTGANSDIQNDNAWLQVGQLSSARDLRNTSNAQMNITGNVNVGRDFTNSATATTGLRVTGDVLVGNDLVNASNAKMNLTGDLTVGRDLSNAANAVMSVTQGNAIVGRNLTNLGDIALVGVAHTVGGQLSNLTTDADLSVTGTTNVAGNFVNEGRATMVGNTTVGGFMSNDVGGTLTVTGNTDVTGNVFNAGNAVMTLNGTTNLVGGNLTNDVEGTLTITGTTKTVNGSMSNGSRGILSVTGNTEVNGNMSNAAGGTLTVTGDTRVSGNVSNANNGLMTLNGTTNVVGGNLTNAADAALYITGTSTTLAGVLTNTGFVKQTGDVVLTGTRDNNTVGRLTQDGVWTLGSNALLKANDLAGNGLFCLSASVGVSACSGDAKNLTLELSSDNQGSNFDGVFSGAGSLQKTGTGVLNLTAEQTFTGGLLVSGGTISVGGANGRMADTLDIVIGAGGTYISNNVDTVRSIVNNGNNSLVINANLTTTEGVVNNGRTALAANLNSAQGFVNNGRLEVSGGRVMNLGTVASTGVTEVRAGLSGASTGTIALGTSASLTVNQNGDTAYAGSIARTGSDTTSALVKIGTGTLSLGGLLNVKNITIDEGTLALTAANTVSNDASVTVNSVGGRTGTLQLIQGDQRFFSLNGAGNIVLGSNNLTVVNGGDFTGAITGSGNVNVLNSMLRVTDVVSQAAYGVSNGSMVNVAGSLSASSMNVASGGTLKLGSTGASANLNVSDTIHVSGMLTGTGTVTGTTIIQNGGWLAPGQSPGILSFNNPVILQSGSTTEMEVKNTGEAAGVGYDRSQFASTLTIESGAILEIKAWGTAGPGVVIDRSLALGVTKNLFEFAPGQITGVFGTANNTSTDLGLLNLATGNAVGLGTLTPAAVAAQATSDNERAMYNGLNVSKAGNVVQFYGGRFIENLTAAMAAGTSTKAVFNAYNPESYFSLSDVGQEAAQLALPTWKSDLQGKDQFIAFAGKTTNATRNDENRQSFGLKTNHTNIGVARDIGNRKSVVFTLANINANTNSHTLQSSGNGLSAAAVLMGAMDAMPNGVWHVGLTHSDIDMSGTRQNLNGGAKFNDIGVRTNQLDFGLESKHNFGSSYIMGRTSLALGSTNRAAITEADYVNSLDKMSVEASRVSYKLWNIGMEMGTQLTSNTTMFGSLSFQSAGLNNKAVTAGFDKNQARFSVNANSALSSTTKVMTGLRHKYADGKVFQASVGAGQSWERNTDVIGNVSLTIPF